MSLLIDLLEFFARLLRASDDGTQRGDSEFRSLVQASAVGDEDIEGWLWGSLQSYLPILFGLLGAPLLMAVHELWLAPWSDFGSETDVLALFLWVAPVGLAFWYLAGLLWRGATGCAGPAFGILLLFVASVFIASDAGWGVITEVLAGAVLAAVLGIVAYPFGVLGRVLFGRGPLLGVAWGALLLAICGIGIVSAPAPGDFWTIGLATWFAPACLVAGMGTLLLVVPMVQRQGDTTTIEDEEARPLSDLIAALRLEASAKAVARPSRDGPLPVSRAASGGTTSCSWRRA